MATMMAQGDVPDDDDEDEDADLLRRPKYRPTTRARMTAATTQTSAVNLVLDRRHSPSDL